VDEHRRGVGHKQDVPKHKIFRSETQNIMRLEDTQSPPSPSTDGLIVLRVRNAKHFAFRTITLAQYDPYVREREGGGLQNGRSWSRGEGGPESQFLVRRR